MKDMKRGKLRSVSTRPMYDEKQNISGYTVSADHDAEDSGSSDAGYSRSMPSIDTPHETMESANVKHTEHVTANAARFGAKKKSAPMDESPMRAAMGRKK